MQPKSNQTRRASNKSSNYAKILGKLGNIKKAEIAKKNGQKT